MNVQSTNCGTQLNNVTFESPNVHSYAKLPMALAVICVMALTLAQASGIRALIIGVLVLYLVMFILARPSDIIPLMLFFLPWSPILKIAPGTIAFSSIATLIVGVKLCKNGVIKIPKFSFLASLLLLLATLFSKLIHGYALTIDYMMFFMMVFLFPCMVYYVKDRISFENCTVFYAIGIISATVMSVLFADVSNISVYISNFQFYGTNTVRLCGFYGDPNFFATQIVSAIGCLLVLVRNKRKKTSLYIIMVAALLGCGLLSVSKTFIIATALIFVLFLLALGVNKDRRMIRTLIWCAVLITVILATGAFSEQIHMLLVRFRFTGDISSFTTGRTDLWAAYIESFMDHPVNFLIGQGYTSVFNGVPKGSHNTILQIIYQFGLVGSIVLGMWIYSFKISFAKVKKTDLLVVMFALFFTWMGLDMLYFDDFFLTIVLFTIAVQYLAGSGGTENDSQNFRNLFV